MDRVLNSNHIKVKRCCASCQHRCIENDGSRVCELMQVLVEQAFRCEKWQMSDGLKRAGLLSGGVVRLIGTTEIIIR